MAETIMRVMYKLLIFEIKFLGLSIIVYIMMYIKQNIIKAISTNRLYITEELIKCFLSSFKEETSFLCFIISIREGTVNNYIIQKLVIKIILFI